MTDSNASGAQLQIRLLGDLEVLRAGEPVELPRSKKTRALLAYLALEKRATRRERLCTIFWDMPDDPKGALRWSLSKLRPVLDEPDEKRLISDRDRVSISTNGTEIDVSALHHAQQGADSMDTDELEHLALTGGLLEGFELPRCPDFEIWLASERENVRSARLTVLKSLIQRYDDDPARAVDYARTQVELEPYSTDARIQLVDLLVASGRAREADRQIQLARDIIRQAGLSVTALNAAWAKQRKEPPAPPIAHVATTLDERSVDNDHLSESSLLEGGELTLPRRPSIAVLPFATLGRGTDHDVLADGLTHDLISRLSSLRWLFVIARGSSFAFRDPVDDVTQVAKKLGVRYIAQGSLQSGGDRIRVHAALVDAVSGSELWAEQFDRKLDDIFAIQDEISNAITGSLETEIEQAEQRRALMKPPESLDAWSAYHRGLWHAYRPTRADVDQAELLFRRAIELDPTFSRPFAGLSFACFKKGFLGHTTDFNGAYQRALHFANESIGLDQRDSLGHWAHGRAMLMLHEHDQSIESLETSIALNPNFAGAHFSLSRSLFAEGSSERGIEATDLARRLSPCDPQFFAMLSVRGNCLAQLGRYDEAADWVMRAVRQTNAHHHILAIATYCTALAGRLDVARDNLAQLLDKNPNYKSADFFQAFPIKRQEHRDLVLEGLKKAGFEN